MGLLKRIATQGELLSYERQSETRNRRKEEAIE